MTVLLMANVRLRERRLTPQRVELASLPGPTSAPLATEQLPVQGYGTVCRHISEMHTVQSVPAVCGH